MDIDGKFQITIFFEFLEFYRIQTYYCDLTGLILWSFVFVIPRGTILLIHDSCVNYFRMFPSGFLSHTEKRLCTSLYTIFLEALRVFFFQMRCFILKVFWSDKTQVWEVKQIDWVVFIIIKSFYTLNFLYYETFDWATSYKLTNQWSALIFSNECLVYMLCRYSSRPQTLQLTYRIFVDRE